MLNFSIRSQACASFEAGYLPKVTFVVVQKRHHTRFFPVSSDQTDKSGNIMPGFSIYFLLALQLVSVLMPIYLYVLIVLFEILSKVLW